MLTDDTQERVSILIPFSGFYESVHDALIERAIEGLFENEQGDSDVPEAFWNKYNGADIRKAYASEYVEAFKQHLANEYDLNLDSLEFESLSSPREYNFTTDRIFCTITRADVLRIYENTTPLGLKEVIDRRHTSRSGFISFYSTDITEWNKPLTEYDHNELETLLIAAIEQCTERPVDEALNDWEMMEAAVCNGDIHSLVYDNLPQACKDMADAWYAANRENAA